MEGGRALADLLFGKVSPSGKLPFTVPHDEADLPFFDKDADAIDYGPLHGYTLLEAQDKPAAYPFGFGLSYAGFAYRGLTVRRAAEQLHVSVAVANQGSVTADEVVQLYVGFPGTAAPRPKKLLRGFQRVSVEPGQTKVVRFSIPISSLTWWNETHRRWDLERGAHTISVGASSNAADLIRTTVII